MTSVDIIHQFECAIWQLIHDEVMHMANGFAMEAQLRIEADRLAAAEARIERQASDFAARDAERAAYLAAEQAKTAKAIEAFSVLADRLDALANANQRQPFLKRLKQRLVG
jgi:hypothetical protein